MAVARRSLAAALVLAVLGLAPVAHADDPHPVRILVLGDSVTQGSAGDYTWRYRAWRALVDAGVDVDLVGPRTDVYDTATGQFGSTAYDAVVDADPAHPFDRDHAARWGMTLAVPDDDISGLVEAYHPDVVVEARGINDFAYLGNSSPDVAGLVREEVAAARGVDPGVDFVLAQLPQVWIGADEGGVTAVQAYNQQRLPALAAELSTDASRIVVAGSGTGFTQLVDTWDRAHLTATGELKMAAAVDDALATLGIGTGYPRPLPPVTDGHWGTPYDVVATPGDAQVTLAWVRPIGGRDTFVWRRDLTAGGDWQQVAGPDLGESWTDVAVTNGHDYRYRLQSAKGSAVSPDFTAEVAARPLPPVPGAVTGLALTTGDGSMQVAWPDVPAATSYRVTWTRRGATAGSATEIHRSPAVLVGLVAGARYDVTVTALNVAGSGPAASGAAVALEAATPPSGRLPVAVEPGPHRMTVRWYPVLHATGYEVRWVGRTTGRTGTRTVRSAPQVVGGLLAGERYDVTVTALNDVGRGSATRTTVVPTGPHVAAPTQVRATAAGQDRAVVRWHGRARATSYQVWIRHGGRWRLAATVSGLRAGVRLGAGPVQVKVRAWHQRLPGGWSSVVTLR